MKMTKVNQKQADDNFILITIVILPLEEAALTAAACLEDDHDSESSMSPQGKQEDESIIAAFMALAANGNDGKEGDESKGNPRCIDLAEGQITREVEFPSL
jgi:hypothetical protein